jgi:hypothetical protein
MQGCASAETANVGRHRARGRYTLATIRQHAAAIAWAHRAKHFDNPVEHETVAAVLSGIANSDYERKAATSEPTRKRAQGLRQCIAARIADKFAEKVDGGNGRLRNLRDLAVVLVARDWLVHPLRISVPTRWSSSWGRPRAAVSAIDAEVARV